MALASELFRANKRLQAALVQDSSHVTLNSQGEHVRLIQIALVRLGEELSGGEYAAALYGPATADAVRSYKTKRDIINYSYQTATDDIVGKMTIRSLDNEVRLLENAPTLEAIR
jgi:peptidoglycan hydrolase-like protein with peptidoglycan-binding domain